MPLTSLRVEIKPDRTAGGRWVHNITRGPVDGYGFADSFATYLPHGTFPGTGVASAIGVTAKLAACNLYQKLLAAGENVSHETFDWATGKDD